MNSEEGYKLWRTAKVLRALAARRDSKTKATALFVMAAKREAEALALGFDPSTIPRKEQGDASSESRTTLPTWFREAARKLKCSLCGSRHSVWWYWPNFKRMRLARLATLGRMDLVQERTALATVACRACALMERP